MHSLIFSRHGQLHGTELPHLDYNIEGLYWIKTDPFLRLQIDFYIPYSNSGQEFTLLYVEATA
jgi:hypothetical protein